MVDVCGWKKEILALGLALLANRRTIHCQKSSRLNLSRKYVTRPFSLCKGEGKFLDPGFNRAEPGGGV
jgi:hypothetical protein